MHNRKRPWTRCAAVLALIVLVTPEARGQAASTDAYATYFRQFIGAGDGRTDPLLGPGRLPDPRTLAHLADLDERRDVADLSSAAMQVAAAAPGDIDRIVAALRQTSPRLAPRVTANLTAALPGLFGSPAPIASAATAASSFAANAPAAYRNDGSSQPTGTSAQAIAAAVSSIASDPGTLEPAVVRALAAAPAERDVVLAAISSAFPGFAGRIAQAADGRTGAVATPLPAVGRQPAAPAGADARAEDALDETFDDEFDDLEAEASRSRIDDPIEPVNRMIFAINDALDTVILRPVATVYSTVTPDPVIHAVRRFFLNLNAPVVLANDVLQTEFSDAGVTLGRFMVNTTAGLLGFFDIAEGLGLPRHEADFGQTLHSYGSGGGPYLVLPLFGPSNLRDGTGLLVDTALNPLTWLLEPGPAVAVGVTRGVSKREELLQPLDELRASSVDYYAALRSAHVQKRKAELVRRSGGDANSQYNRLFDEAR